MAAFGVALLCTLLFVALRTGEATGQTAEGDGCTPTCVILIQVDGLEPKDVTPATTPYLWHLAHPTVQGQNVPGGALNQRSGWIWQAPRGVVSSGVAPATASLLTGGFPEKTGVPADDFHGPNADGAFAHQRLTAGGFGDSPHPEAGLDVAEPVSSLPVDTLIGAVANAGGQPAVFLGDPGLARLTEAASQGRPHWFPPGGEEQATVAEQQFTGDPRLCPIPRYPDGGAAFPGQAANFDYEANFNPSHCPANDMTTMNKAASDLSTRSGVGFTFIHLAELGAAKRLAIDPDVDDTALDPDPTSRPPQPADALSHMDQAIATFVERYAQDDAAKWQKTVLMIVGSNGYQTTPVANRIPYPGVTGTEGELSPDLSDYVAEFEDGDAPRRALRLVPQGTMATIYYGLGGVGEAKDRQGTLEAIREDLLTTVRDACRARNPVLVELHGPCIKDVWYVDKDAATSDQTVDGQRETWRLDARHPDTGARTGASGDLIVEFGRGWAVGRAVAIPYQLGLTGQPATNPNTASAGGPQERAVAALINGPSQGGLPGAVRNLDTFASTQFGPTQIKYYPVSNQSVDPSDPNNPPPPSDPKCPDTTTDPGGLACANDPEQVIDDAYDPGHEAQPVTVDFALTISALMQLPFDSHPDQLQGRVLQEAFLNKLAIPRPEEDPPPPPQCTDVLELTQSATPVTVTFSCRDAADTPLTYSVVSGPEHGTLGPVVGDTVRYTPAAGFSGIDSFTYQASNGTDTSDVATAFITVIEPPVVEQRPGFNFFGLIQKLKARVVAARDRTYRRAPRGARFSTVLLEADFGKPETAVTLTFYRRVVTKARRSNRSRRSRRGRGRRVVRLKAIARFDPFAVKRGHVTMRLKVPKLFKPHYVGVHLREIALDGSGRRIRLGADPCTTLKTRKRVPFRCTGPTRGVIVRIADAGRLHTVKGGKRKKAPKRTGTARRRR